MTLFEDIPAVVLALYAAAALAVLFVAYVCTLLVIDEVEAWGERHARPLPTPEPAPRPEPRSAGTAPGARLDDDDDGVPPSPRLEGLTALDPGLDLDAIDRLRSRPIADAAARRRPRPLQLATLAAA